MPGKVTAMHPATHTSPVGGLLAALAITGVIAFIWYRIRRPRAAAWSPSYTNVTHEHRGPGAGAVLAILAGGLLLVVAAVASSKPAAVKAAAKAAPAPHPSPSTRIEVVRQTVTRYVQSSPVHHLLSGGDVVLIVLIGCTGLCLVVYLARHLRPFS